MDKALDEWIDRISSVIQDGAYDGIAGLREHIKKHASELTDEKSIPKEWIASMKNLIDILEHVQQSKVGSEKRAERLYLHWLDDPKNMIPPPGEYLLYLTENKGLPGYTPKAVADAQKAGIIERTKAAVSATYPRCEDRDYS